MRPLVRPGFYKNTTNETNPDHSDTSHKETHRAGSATGWASAHHRESAGESRSVRDVTAWEINVAKDSRMPQCEEIRKTETAQ